MNSQSIKKSITAFAVITLIILLVTSCKRYLDNAPQGELTDAVIGTDPNAAVNLTNGVYNSLWLGDAFGGPDVHSLSYIILTNVASDDADKGSSPTDYGPALEVDNFTLSANNSIVNGIWRGYYQAIARTNQALTYLPTSPLNDASKNRLIGEVKFIRAYLYFNMVRFFGGVPKIDRVPSPQEANSAEFQTRASKDSIYRFIIDDLQFGVNNLPVKGQTAVGKATKGAAQSLLAKVYLYQKKWQEAYDLTNSVMSGQFGQYDLLPQYENIWRQVGANSIESIFEVQTGKNASCDAAINVYAVSQGPRAGGKRGWQDLGFGFNNPSLSLANAYEPNDKRKNGTIIFINPSPQGTVLWDGFRVPSQDSVENSRYNYKAYHSRTLEDNCGNNDKLPKNLRILRFGEVLLLNAEAANELGKTNEAQVSLNKIRQRAGLGNITGLSQAALRDTIWHERRVELAMEHDRFFDIVRQGKAGQILRAQGKSFVDGKNELFPIPQPQIDLSNGNLKQNPGY